MNHTLETLLPLPDSPEGLGKLRILTAEADGLIRYDESYSYPRSSNGICKRIVWKRKDETIYTSDNLLPRYTTSLDAIFAAEERLECHDVTTQASSAWKKYVYDICIYLDIPAVTSLTLTPSYRCIPYILTAQEIRAAVKDAQ